MTIEELFGTLQQSVVSAWRKHLRTAKYAKHIALNEFYEEMPEKVDALIEAWMGVNGRKIKSYDNILQSKNMNTLVYLKELRSVVKQGYALMNGEAELEAKLDDIVELIDSTLYKVKELSESKFIDLKDFLTESLITEAKNEVLGIWHFAGDETLHICIGSKNDIDEATDRLDGGYSLNSTRLSIPGNMVSIKWNDESCYMIPLKGNNWNAVKNNDIKKIEGFLKDRSDDYVYIESDIFGSGNEWYDEDAEETKKWNAKKWLDHFIKMVEGSYVDGDSNYCRTVVDLAKKEVCCKGENDVIIWDVNDFMKTYFNEE